MQEQAPEEIQKQKDAASLDAFAGNPNTCKTCSLPPDLRDLIQSRLHTHALTRISMWLRRNKGIEISENSLRRHRDNHVVEVTDDGC